MSDLALFLISLAPFAIGPLPAEQARIVTALCGGGTISIPLDEGEPGQPTDPVPCTMKACHAGECRKRGST